MITRAETIDAEAKSNNKETKTVSTNFNEKILLVKHNISIFYLLFLLITIALLITLSVFCYLIKYQRNIYYHCTPQIRSQEVFYINNCIIKTESNDKLKEIDINNCTCYYFDDIIKIEDFDPDNILIDKKSQENNLFYNISLKKLIDSKPLHIRFDKIDGFIRFYDRTRYLVLFGSEKFHFSSLE